MAWEDRYQQGSLGGAFFYMKRHSHQGKHRVATYKYPESDRIDYVRQGRDDFTFSMSVYVVGGRAGADDYDVNREKLWRILRRGGQTTLVHPYLGTVQVHIRSFSVSETSKEGNIANFRMSLSQVFSQPRRRLNTSATTTLPTNFLLKSLDAFNTDMLRNYQLQRNSLLFSPQNSVDLSRPFFAGLLKIHDFLSGKMDFLRAGLDKALVAVAAVSTGMYTVVSFKRKLSAIRSQQDRLLLNAAQLYTEFTELLTIGYEPYANDPVRSYRRFINMIKLSSVSVVENNMFRTKWRTKTPEELVADTKKAGVIADVFGEITDPTHPINIMKQVAFIESIKQATTMRFTDLSQLSDVEARTVKSLDERLQDETIDTEYRRILMQIKAQSVMFFKEQRGSLGADDIVIPPFDTNAILLTYKQTGSITEFDGIIQNNVIENPSLIVQGTPIKARRS